MNADEVATARRVEERDRYLRQLHEARDLIDTLVATGSAWRDRMIALATELDGEGDYHTSTRIRAQLRLGGRMTALDILDSDDEAATLTREQHREETHGSPA